MRDSYVVSRMEDTACTGWLHSSLLAHHTTFSEMATLLEITKTARSCFLAMLTMPDTVTAQICGCSRRR